jgi:hypothetical protein
MVHPVAPSGRCDLAEQSLARRVIPCRGVIRPAVEISAFEFARNGIGEITMRHASIPASGAENPFDVIQHARL